MEDQSSAPPAPVSSEKMKFPTWVWVVLGLVLAGVIGAVVGVMLSKKKKKETGPTLKKITSAADCTAAGGTGYNISSDGVHYCCGITNKEYKICGGSHKDGGLEFCACL